MNIPIVEITVIINNSRRAFSVGQDESLLSVLRRASYFSVKYGCDDGTCGVFTVLLNGKPVLSNAAFARQRKSL